MRLNNRSRIAVLISWFILPFFILAQPAKTVQNPQEKPASRQEIPHKSSDTIVSQEKPDIDHERLFIESQRNFDRSLSTLNSVVNLIGILVALVTLIIIIGTAAGFFQIRTINKYVNKAARDAKLIEKIRKKLECDTSLFMQSMGEKLSFREMSSKEDPRLTLAARRFEILDAMGYPLKPEHYFLWATYLYQKQDYAGADEILERALKQDPKYAIAWTARSALLIHMGRLKEALIAANKALDLKPNEGGPWYNRACIHSRLKEKDQAIIDLAKAISLENSFKNMASTDEDFRWLWEDADFKRITAE